MTMCNNNNSVTQTKAWPSAWRWSLDYCCLLFNDISGNNIAVIHNHADSDTQF